MVLLFVLNGNSSIAQWQRTAGPYGSISKDNGKTWSPSSKGLPSDHTGGYLPVKKLAESGGIMYAVTYGSYVSRDNGATWSASTNGFASLNVTAVLASASGVYVGAGVFRSSDNGVTWKSVSTNLSSYDVEDLCVVGQRLFAATLGAGVFISLNDGDHWDTANVGLGYPYIQCLTARGGQRFCWWTGIVPVCG